MPLDLKKLMTLHDKAYNSGQVTREKASDDMVFYYVTQWDDNMLADSQLSYRGEFNILKKAGRQIISDLAANPVQIDFEPLNETREDAAEMADGLYRTDDQNNLSIESYELAKQECVVCGVGAWMLYTEYSSLKSNSQHQVIRRRPIQEANNNIVWDPNAKLLDKSDAMYVSVLTAYSEDGYKKLVEDMTGEELETISEASFKHPEQSYAFPWVGGEGKKIYVTEFYHREKVKSKILTMVDPFGQTLEMRESDLVDVMDEMMDEGYSIESEKQIEVWQVTKYIASGAEILNGEMGDDDERVGEVIAGEHIPVVPIYGEHAYIEGEEHYEGVTRLAKDPQRLHNFGKSYVADIVSRSPRQQPIWFQEQLAGFEDMHSQVGSENFYAYLLQNRKAGDGSDLPLGPVGVTPEQTIPSALAAMVDMTRQSVEDVANPGLSQDIADPDISGKAVLALQARLDMQSMVYQQHFKHAKRRDGEIWASMASEIHDVPRKAVATLPDGTRKDLEIMQTVLDEETGTYVTINDMRNAEFEVYSKIGPDYKSQKEQTIEQIGTMLAGMDPSDPMFKALQLKVLEIMDGVQFDDIRDYAKKQLVLMGFKEPETDEEKAMLEQAQQQGTEPSAEMVLAQAEMLKGQAQQEKNQIEMAKVQSGAQNEQMKRMIDEFKAATDRMNTQIDAQEAGATINYKRVDTMGKELDNAAKIQELRMSKVSVADMSDEDLFRQLAG
jgi:hypothetical protein